MTEEIRVQAIFDKAGGVTILAFSWAGDDFKVLSMGRRWVEDGKHHFLVMTPGEDIFELVFAPKVTRWYMHRSPEDLRAPPAVA